MAHATCIGLMSGTSMDAVDAAICRVADGRVAAVGQVASVAYPPALRERLLQLQSAPDTPLTLRELATLDHAVALTFAEAAIGVMNAAGAAANAIDAIGSHGQTVFHDPVRTGNSLQLGDPGLIAARTGVPVVADFRRADIACGGQGAPLVPAFHVAAFGALAPCAILNIGGIANLTVLDAGGGVRGFDTGPGNGLMDAWIAQSQGAHYDRDGTWAAAGNVDVGLLQACLADAYFAQPPPKSTGRDRFNLDWLRQRCPSLDACAPVDVQRTLCELTAQSVAMQLRRFADGIARILVCGGGGRNATLMAALGAALPTCSIESTLAAGIDPGAVEPAAFAWLAWRRLQGLPGNLPEATGASRPAVLGGVYAPPAQAGAIHAPGFQDKRENPD